MQRFSCTIRSFLRLCLKMQYPDVCMLPHRIIISSICIKSMDLILESYPRGCYLLVLGDLWEIQPEQGPWPDKAAEGTLGDLAALLTKRFSFLTFHFVKKIFLLLIYFTKTH